MYYKLDLFKKGEKLFELNPITLKKNLSPTNQNLPVGRYLCLFKPAFLYIE